MRIRCANSINTALTTRSSLLVIERTSHSFRWCLDARYRITMPFHQSSHKRHHRPFTPKCEMKTKSIHTLADDTNTTNSLTHTRTHHKWAGCFLVQGMCSVGNYSVYSFFFAFKWILISNASTCFSFRIPIVLRSLYVILNYFESKDFLFLWLELLAAAMAGMEQYCSFLFSLCWVGYLLAWIRNEIEFYNLFLFIVWPMFASVTTGWSFCIISQSHHLYRTHTPYPRAQDPSTCIWFAQHWKFQLESFNYHDPLA